MLESKTDAAALRLAVRVGDCDAPLVTEAAAVAVAAGVDELAALVDGTLEDDATALAEAAPEGDAACDALARADAERAGEPDCVMVGEALAEKAKEKYREARH